METVQITVYKFDELPEDVQIKLIEKEREKEDFEWLYDEARETVEKFFKLSGVKSGRDRWLEFSLSHFEGNILELKGLRLRTWILNNWGDWLYKGKYYSLWSKTEKSFEYHKNGHPVLKKRRSKCQFTKDCVLTGVYYDNDFLEAIYDFIENYKNQKGAEYTTLEDLIQNCFESLKYTIEDEIEALNDDDHISDSIRGQDLRYDINGQQINF